MTVPNSKWLRVLRDMALTAGPKIAGGVLILLLNVGLVFVWPPVIYGNWAFWLMLVFLADALIGAPFDLAVIRLAQSTLNDASSADVPIISALGCEHAAMIMKMLLLLPAGLVFIVTGQSAGEVASGEPLALPSLAALGAFLLLRSTLVHLQMRRRFASYGAVETLHVVLRLTFAGFAVWLAGLGPAALMWSFAAAAASATAFSVYASRRSLLLCSDGIASAARATASQVSWYLPTIALGAVIGRLDLLLMGWLSNAQELGQYGAAANFAVAPELVGTYLGIALLPTLVSHVQAGLGRRFLVQSHAVMLSAALSMYAAAFVLAEPLLLRYAPQAYASMVPLLLILLGGTLAGMLTTPLALPLVLLTQKDFLLKTDFVVAPVAFLAYWIAIPAFGAMGTATVATAVHVVRSIAVHAMAWRLSAHVHDLRRH
ncbi:hypothetical protein [Bosea sp. AAP35]|uniref:lipopolysaccharide biosynthesis protein n=1 Tax=Bosea sp. AAP35 TaxID=1523417 RepID=UPI0012E30A2D|nr:hypothetical protein [Bosea sp. AAP35]